MKQETPHYTRDLVNFLAGLQPSGLAEGVVDRGRYLLLDYLGVAIRGSCSESSAPVYRMIDRMRMIDCMAAPGSATVIGKSIRTLPGYAALANGTAAHAIELDDTHNAGSIHLGVVMFSTALALAETLPDIQLDQFFTTVAAGYEAAARIAMAVQPKEHYLLGFHPTSTCGVFGAAVTASKLLGLTADQMLSAVGIAGSMTAGSLEFLADGAWTKRLHPGLAAQNGIQAAMLAAEGFRGPSRILDGRDGFLKGYSRRPLPDLLTDGLGESFEILRTSVKPYACCRYMQGPIDAILALVHEHDIRPAQVRQIEVAVLKAGWPLVVEPRDQKYHPKSVVEAQFSMPYGAAVAVIDRAAGLEQFSAARLQSPDLHGFMDKVVMTENPEIEKTFPEEWPAVAIIHLEDGRSFENMIRHPKGDPKNPLTWPELIAKFRALAGPVLPPDRLEQIVAQVKTGDSLAGLTTLCTPYEN